ncbi:putative glycosyltransferase [Calothrix sp. NIES-4071]|nr:putative glycosyltransferase [Calothrix sp. NIES-4071]BAZ56063.1 putative glycosyltransferase [Calothrix sp. NIES-4105]
MVSEFETKQTQAQLRTTQLELEHIKAQLQTTQAELAQSQGIVSWMQTSKFWKLRLQFIESRNKIKTIKQKLQAILPKKHFTHTLSISTSDTNFHRINLPRYIPEKPTVLLIVEETLPQCFRYRVQQKLEQLQALKYKVSWVSWRHYKQAQAQLHFCHIAIFYRVPAFKEVVETIKYAKSLNKIVFFDIDDLIFNGDAYPEPYENLVGQVSPDEYEGLVQGVKLYREALTLCDYAIASTPSLAQEMERVIGNVAWCHRNAIDNTLLQFMYTQSPKIARDYISIFYGSGTKTHDADFSIVAPAIARIMEKYPNVRLTIVGYLTLPDLLAPYTDRIDRIGLLSNLEVYWEFLSQADINIAPLKPNLFNDCKSEIKWLEAAVLGVPSLVSDTKMYLEILQDGEDVLIASTEQEWFEKLNQIVGDAEYRLHIALQAKQKALHEYHPTVMAENFQNILEKSIEEAVSQNRAVRKTKTKLLFVNVLYPPQALGGATGVVKNIIDTLKEKFDDRYEISVFTYDLHNPSGYELCEYVQDSVHVTRLSLPPYPDIDWRYQDQRVYEIFSQYLKITQPDLIHFHCIQRLTASVLEAAADLNISSIVTVHDAWWICDHQFMLDRDGVERDFHQNDPLVVARYADDLNKSLARRRYLAKQLNRAIILAVSEFQASLYSLNGFTQIRVNRNGIKPLPVLPRTSSKRIRLGFAGGICIHKGYYFLKEAITAANLHNTDLTVIDLFMDSVPRYETWGSTPVQFIPKLAPERMADFYSQIDVLVAPSLWSESFGLITREASAAGVWVVASNKGGLAEDICPGITGDLFSPDDMSELVQILKRIEQAPHKYQQQLTSNTQHIRKIEEQVYELETIYESIAILNHS